MLPAPPELECINISHNQLKLMLGDAKVTTVSPGMKYIVVMENTRQVWQQIYTIIRIK